jgi:hypothetical protein
LLELRNQLIRQREAVAENALPCSSLLSELKAYVAEARTIICAMRSEACPSQSGTRLVFLRSSGDESRSIISTAAAHCLRVSKVQGFRVSGFQGFRVSGFQGFRVSGFQGCKVAK